MKPTIVCKNFEPPENLDSFMTEAIGDILRISPYDSHLEASVQKESNDYLMTISIHYSEGQFSTIVRDSDLKRVITQSTADIFTQVRSWWKSRFGKDHEERTDWAGNFTKSDPKQIEKMPPTNDLQIDTIKKPIRVLIVDDDIESVTPLELCLEKLGCTTFVVNNGFEAIHEMVSNNRTYDVVILDWNMPEMSGGQALLNAQKVIFHTPSVNNHWENQRLPVITYSASSRDEIEMPKCRDFQHVDHWEKPASYLHLLNQVKETFLKLAA